MAFTYRRLRGITLGPSEELKIAYSPTGTKIQFVGKLKAGGDSPKTIELSQEVKAGTAGYRQGVLGITINRASDQAFTATWDGNPDQILNVVATNRASNLDGATRIGALRGMTIQARNRGTNLSWIETISINARNDSGKNISEMRGLKIVAENYGNIYTHNYGLRIQMLDENVTQSQERVPVTLENIDQSAQAALQAAIKILHTSTNGFSASIWCATNSGDGAAANVVTPSGATVEALIVRVGANIRYIPIYSALTMN